jgi:hypothetical protein
MDTLVTEFKDKRGRIIKQNVMPLLLNQFLDSQ